MNATFFCDMCGRIRPYSEQHELISKYLTWFVCQFCYEHARNDDEYREFTQLVELGKALSA